MTAVLLVGFGAALVYSLSKKWLLAIVVPTSIAMWQLARRFGAFAGNADATAMYLGWGLVIGAMYVGSAAIGLGLAIAAEKALKRKEP